MISKYEHFTASYFLTRSLFLGIGFSLITGIAKQDSILAFFIGTLIGLFFIFFINQIQKYKGKKSLHDVLKEMKFLGILLRIVFLIFGICLFAESLTFFNYLFLLFF